MRITEARLLEITTRGVDRAKQSVGVAGQELASGVRVRRPSDDPTAWIDGMRARARRTISEAQGQAIARSKDRLSESELRVREMMDILSMARERAVMLANETHSASTRQLGAEEISVVRDRMLNLLNTRGTDGEYLFAGSISDAAPFDATGLYQGDTGTRSVETPDGGFTPMSVPGSDFTSQNGLDVLGTLDSFLGALQSNNVQGIRQSLTEFDAAFDQVTGVLHRIGARDGALRDAQEAREDLDVQLDTIYSDRVATDPVDAAMSLTRAQNALQASQLAIQQIVAMTRIN